MKISNKTFKYATIINNAKKKKLIKFYLKNRICIIRKYNLYEL